MITYFNRFEIKMTKAAALDCSHSGDCEADVNYWTPKIKKLNRKIKNEDIQKELKEYGAWEENELKDFEQNWKRIIWLAAGNIRDEIRS